MSKRVPDPADPDKSIEIYYISADLDLAETLGLQLQKGRLLDKKFPSDVKAGNPNGEIIWKEEQEIQ
ncbi:hypothetical protein LZ575_20370 [Antarcticibacterium sp. 1MA-6-2]|uniref:hypothetical protein n=1 Tax=Antarcticibacterium sp. 1MA-6-2 TaxID=2908210 RepID=UPI001F3B58DD|nr:hypothetical protein [Antarcticibacterium sp. 1MA-6-2]UJH91001.1 hypothetical protein LZ575_20370 [Antarcticibacterium sp. 1MA-6-2]